MPVVETKKKAKKRVPFAEGYLSTPLEPLEETRLMGSRCRRCAVPHFGIRAYCENCGTDELEQVEFGTRGSVYSFTIARFPPPPPYAGPTDPFVPYPIAWVDLPEGVRVLSTLTGCGAEEVEIGMSVELVVEKGWVDEQENEVLCYRFKPVKDG